MHKGTENLVLLSELAMQRLYFLHDIAFGKPSAITGSMPPARRVLEYVGDDTIEKDDFLDADRELQTMARAILVRLGKRPDKAVGGED